MLHFKIEKTGESEMMIQTCTRKKPDGNLKKPYVVSGISMFTSDVLTTR